ncbi:MAG: flavohemoglobin expression-modulating QEGLA motif protein [Peptostreptococcaceae bacterium]|nr:flavohemoglobin expression-modulating QEGLA motif protein [Peptostreptococcaceae bacterium]
MYKLSINEIIEKINKQEVFSATADNGGFTIIIEKYVPFICAAIHNGNELKENLADKCLLDKKSRWNEEDPLTGDFIESLPIRIIANDSRYEYDLNRQEDEAIYDIAWGKPVWKEELSTSEKAQSLEKHKEFYIVLKALVEKIEEKFGASIVYDVHSYNYRRSDIHEEYPVFNLGTEKVDKNKYSKYVNRFVKELSKIKFENIENRVAENEVFFGRGYFAKFITEAFDNTVVLPLEVKKIYCDENNGDIFSGVVNEISEGMKRAIISTSLYFINNETNYKVNNKAKLLSNIDDPVHIAIDKKLYALLRNFETLVYVNPRNLEHSKKIFFDSRYRKEPDFKYIPLRIDPYELKKSLYQLPITDMQDVSIQSLYKEIIREYSVTIDMLASRGTDEFLYNSLKLYGKPDRVDVMNANYIIQSYGKDNEGDKNLVKEDIYNMFSEELKSWNMGGKIVFHKNMAARIMVNSAKKTLVINDKAEFNKNDIKLLSQHELGIHMLTTMNASNQPLKFLSLGTPNNVETQEGVAVLAEFLTGTMHINRLKDLAYRVIAVNKVIKGDSFREIFEYFMEEHDFDRDKAFNLTARVLRGGGFTKDYLYLKGFIKIYNYFISGKSMQEFLIGKTSIEYIDLINELFSRGYIKKPKYTNEIFENGEIDDPIIEYILKGTK